MKELDLGATVGTGSRGKRVRRCQEWLTLNGFALKIDEDFGPATAFAARSFQKSAALSQTGQVNARTFGKLCEPLARALDPVTPASNLGRTLVKVARKHLRAGAREVGGDNRGPWVRTYMRGQEGRDFFWCAGFVSTLLEQATAAQGESMPIPWSMSCDRLALSARERRRFVARAELDPAEIRPGWLFLVRRAAEDWNHVGIVVSAGAEHILTIEGNTNDGGSREGIAVLRRIRSLGDKDYIRI